MSPHRPKEYADAGVDADPDGVDAQEIRLRAAKTAVKLRKNMKSPRIHKRVYGIGHV
jgi:hypothetical protein